MLDLLISLSFVAAIAEPPPQAPEDVAALRQRAAAELPGARENLDTMLTDYPSARFREVRAVLTRSVHYTDGGQSNRVPWAHRGGLVLVFCGQINSRNRMGGYTGWQPFAYRPAQTDLVEKYDFSTPRRLVTVNVAEDHALDVAGTSSTSTERVELLCGTPDLVDPLDLSASLAHSD